MANHIRLNPGTGGDLSAAEEISGGVANGAKAQLVKLGTGGAGAFNPVSASDPLPVVLPAGAATEVTLAAILAAIQGTLKARLVDGSGDSAMDDGNNAARVNVVVGGGGGGGGSPPANATVTRVATSNASAQLLASNSGRRGVVILNESDNTLYVKFGATASTTDYTRAIPPGEIWESQLDTYTGRIDAILDTGSGNAQITELTS